MLLDVLASSIGHDGSDEERIVRRITVNFGSIFPILFSVFLVSPRNGFGLVGAVEEREKTWNYLKSLMYYLRNGVVSVSLYVW